MKTIVSHINGHDYVYAYDRIYIAHGVSKQIHKSLGPARLTIDVASKEFEFQQFVKQQEVKKRLAYWHPKIRDSRFLAYIPMEKMESLRSELYRAKKNMGTLGTQLMEAGFLVDFIYNSNRLEGSKVPRARVEQEVREKKTTKGEVGNALRALVEVNTKFRFNSKHIVQLHSILMAHEPEKIGLRKDRVIVGNSEVLPWDEVKNALIELCRWYEQNRFILYPPELAFDFYYQFERIHPFEDGNGRTGRLIMNRILRDHKYHPMIISWRRRQAQENAFIKRMEGRKELFYRFMKEEFVKTYEIYIAKIESALGVDRLSQVFMQPSAHYE